MSLSITHIASGSSGNAVMVDDGSTKLLFDAGLPFSKLSKAVQFRSIEGIFITHEHMDHFHAVPELINRGRKVYMSKGTCEAKSLPKHEVKILSPLRQIAVGTFNVHPFDVIHDEAEPLGFLFASVY